MFSPIQTIVDILWWIGEAVRCDRLLRCLPKLVAKREVRECFECLGTKNGSILKFYTSFSGLRFYLLTQFMLHAGNIDIFGHSLHQNEHSVFHCKNKQSITNFVV